MTVLNGDNRSRGFWIGLAIIFILAFLASYSLASADEPTQIPVEEDFFIGQIVNVHVGHWTTGDIVDYDSAKDLYKIKVGGFKIYGNDPQYIERQGKQISARSKGRPPKRSLEVLPDEPVRQSIKPDGVPEFKFKKGAEVISHHRGTPWGGSENVTTRITDRAVLWGENVYRVERNRRRSPGDNGPGIWYETISEKDLQLPPKKQPEYVEGLR